MATHGNNFTHVCPTSFSKPTENIQVACGPTTMPTTTRKLKPHSIRTGQLLTPHFLASASLGEPERHWAVSTAAPSNMIQQSARARKATAQPMRTSKAFIRNNKNKGRMYASTETYNRPCHTTPCRYKHECIKCFPEEHSFTDSYSR